MKLVRGLGFAILVAVSSAQFTLPTIISAPTITSTPVSSTAFPTEIVFVESTATTNTAILPTVITPTENKSTQTSTTPTTTTTSSDSHSTGQNNVRTIGVAVGVSLGLLLILAGGIFFYFKRYRLTITKRENHIKDHDCSKHDHYKPPKRGEAELPTKEQQYSELPAKSEIVYHGPMPPRAAELSATKSVVRSSMREV